MKKLLILATLCLSNSLFAMNAPAIPLASNQVEAYDAAMDAPLLVKLQKKQPLTVKDKARMEVLYQAKYVGEEELNPTQLKIYKYANKMLTSKQKKAIEKRADSQGM